MFSRRSEYAESNNRLSRLLHEQRGRGCQILDLTESNPTRADFSYPDQEILAALAEPASLLYQPAPLGLLKAREAIADYYAQRGGQQQRSTVNPEHILLTASTSEAYSYLFKILADPGDQVLVPQPGYPLFEFLARGESVEALPYRLLYQDGWQIDIESLSRQISPRSRALVLIHPNNPTGSFVKAEEWTVIQNLCARHNLSIICDEVFFDFPLESSLNPVDPLCHSPLFDSGVLIFVLNGLSKIVGLPQMKLSWLVPKGPAAKTQDALRRLEVISDTFLSVNTLIQHATAKLLPLRRIFQQQVRQRTSSNLEFLQEILEGSTATVLKVEGGWYAIIRLAQTRTEEEWVLHLLEQYDLLLHPGYFYDFSREAFVVASLIPPEKAFREGTQRLLQACSEHLRAP
ncbi:MAG: pyridoxal phosphate-dependent aminotransferase [Acidobacteriota bacterium]